MVTVDRQRLPQWTNAMIEWVADHPMSVLGRLAATRLGRPQRGVTVPETTFDEREIRVLIAPVNYSGQATEWARALERRSTRLSARSMAVEVPGGFAFAVDTEIPVATYHNDVDWQKRQFDAVVRNATHVLVEAEEPPFGRLLGRDVQRQVRALLEKDVSVAFMCHGTDVRLPSRHVSRTEWSMFSDPSVYTTRQEKLARRNRALIDELGLPVFVSTPDLLDDVPTATWCPVVVDSDRWRRESSTETTYRGPMRVVHAPSSSVVKGTEQILPTLVRLQDEGVISLTLVQNTPTSRMPMIFGSADVVVDQFRIGSYGVAACEAMAAGCVVVGHVLDEVRDHVANVGGHALPIVEANPNSLEACVRGLAADREAREAVALSGPEFVAQVHDGRFSSRVLDEHWLLLDRGDMTPPAG